MEKVKNDQMKKAEEIQEIKQIMEPFDPTKEAQESWIDRMKSKLETFLKEKKARAKQAEWEKTEEGKRITLQFKEMEESRREDLLRQEKKLGEIRHEAMQQLALELESEALIKKFHILPSDPRLNEIERGIIDLRNIVASAYIGR